MSRAQTAENVTTFSCLGQDVAFYLPDRGDHVQHQIAKHSDFYEREMLDDMRRRRSPPALALDVGANIGNHTLFLARICGFRVIAIEPNPAALEILRRNVELNGIQDRVEIVGKAAGDGAGQGRVCQTNENNLGMTHIERDPNGKVEIIRIDDIPLPEPVALLKIDVEGMHLQVLRGAVGLIQRDSPAIYVEVAADNQVGETRQLLADLGYMAVERFNVTPTFLFMPARDDPERFQILEARLGILSRRQQRRWKGEAESATSLRDSISHLRARLDGLSEAGQEQSRRARAQIDSEMERLRNTVRQSGEEQAQFLLGMSRADSEQLRAAQLDLRQELQRRLAGAEATAQEMLEAQTNLFEARLAAIAEQQRITNDRLTAELAAIAGEQRAAEDRLEAGLSAIAKQQRAVNDRLRAAERRTQEAETATRRSREEAKQIQANAEELQASAAFQLGRALIDAAKQPLRAPVSLPARIAKIGFDVVRRKRRPPPTQAKGVDTESTETTIASGDSEARAATSPAEPSLDTDFKVSVIMTTFDSRATVEYAVQSILDQTHRNLELIVVDDGSRDDTFAILSALAKKDARIRPIKSFSNRGTYWCKNLGLTYATGHFATFQDSDDISEPTRLERQIAVLVQNPRAIACTCNYVRRDQHGETILNRGLRERLALVSLLWNREDIRDRLGYFDSVRSSADDEMLQRIKLVYGDEAICHVNEPLYVARLVRGSLTTHDDNQVVLGDTSGDYRSFLSPKRRAYFESYRAWHRAKREDSSSPYIPFPLLRRPFAVPRELLPEPPGHEMHVSASVASIPSRRRSLEEVVRAILPQVDQLNVFLNNYDEIPPFLADPKIRVARSQDHGDQRDNGKFFFLAEIAPGYHFTLDDDLAYPPDYVQRNLIKLLQYGGRAIVGSHGVRLATPVVRFYEDRTVFSFKEALHTDTVVNLLGTGTVAYNTAAITLSYDDFLVGGMADLWLAVAAKKQGMPMISIERPRGWLRPLETEQGSLYDEFVRNDEIQTRVARDNEPWKLSEIVRTYEALATELLDAHTEAELRSRAVDVDFFRRVRKPRRKVTGRARAVKATP